MQEDPEKARLAINNWISNKTESLIQDTLPPGVLDSNTVLVLVNTIYFKVLLLGAGTVAGGGAYCRGLMWSPVSGSVEEEV